MPTGGGASDKLGNRYETLWTVDQLLRVVHGDASELTLEPIDVDESRGIEFRVVSADGTVAYWSVKRQTTKAAGWTLAVLAAQDNRGRSILGDLLGHVEQDATCRGVFASTLGARDLEELRAHAANGTMLADRLKRSKDLKADFQNYLVPLCGGDGQKACVLLSRIQTYAADECQLRDRVDFAIRTLFYTDNGLPLDAAAVRGHLCDLLLDHIHQPLRQDDILSALGAHGIRRRDWAIERTVAERIAVLCNSYCEPLDSDLVNGKFLQIPRSNAVLGPNGMPTGPKVLVSGEAGAGKSCTLSATVQSLQTAGIPVVPIRCDQLPEGILTTTELGRRLELPESPTLVLTGVARGGPCVLVVDQLDAVSVASGRRSEVWHLFDSLRREVEAIPSLSLIVGCREFDLEHDHRMRQLRTTQSGFTLVTLTSLTPEQVDAALRDVGIAPDSVSASLKPVLVVPLHLSMYLSLPSTARLGIHGRDELLDRFWLEKERKTDQRLGRKTAWTAVIDKLANWLSSNQQLSAPKMILDDYAQDAAAMTSEHVLVLAEGRYRFFHESFFDYAFARRFAATGGHLLDLLTSGEQHLFRRAQVRQILTYLRASDRNQYQAELEAVLTSTRVRTHILCFILQWMSSLPDPDRKEWEILKAFLLVHPELRSHVRGVITGNDAWFDVLDGAGVFAEALASGDKKREQEAIHILALPRTLQTRSPRVVLLLKQYRKPTKAWRLYLRYVCRHGHIFHNREMFDFFLSLIDDGTLDSPPPRPTADDTWQGMLYSMARQRPDLASEAIAKWLERSLATWQLQQTSSRWGRFWRFLKRQLKRVVGRGSGYNLQLWQHIDYSGNITHVIPDAAKDHLCFAQHILPQVARVANDMATEYSHDELQIDPLWFYRSFREDPIQTHDAILSGLAKSLEALACTRPAELDRLLAPYKDRPHNTIVYLVLRAWTAAPATYADQLADYLAADARRLKVGYSSSSPYGGSASNYVSSQAIKAASARCTMESFAALETAILNLKDEWEAKHPQTRGQTQLELLEAMDESRLSAAGRVKLRELRTKFPQFDRRPPKAGRATFVGSPIPKDAQERMSDDQWIAAMDKYAGVRHRHDRPIESSGGEAQLAQALETQTRANPVRFAALADRMGDDLPADYFNAVLRGVADCTPQPDDPAQRPISVERVIALVRRVHQLPDRPCGHWIAYLVEKWRNVDWPDDIIDLVAWYASNDPDPDKELWKTRARSGQYYHGGNPRDAGINSVRGSMAGALAELLFDKPARFERLKDAVHSVSHDRSVAVRACAVTPLLAVLNIDASTAIAWFRDCLSLNQVLFDGRDVAQFLHFAVSRDYAAMRPVIRAMLASRSEAAVTASAEQVCLWALDNEAPKDDAERVRTGTSPMRKAAAHVYSTNIAHEIVGSECWRLLKPFFADPDEEVRAEAASAFRYISDLSTEMQAELLAAFLGAPPNRKALEEVVRALEDSPIRLPDLVCTLSERCVEAFRDKAGDISEASSMVAMELSKIVIRLYAQTDDASIQRRCLALMDTMEQYHWLGLNEELRRLDR